MDGKSDMCHGDVMTHTAAKAFSPSLRLTVAAVSTDLSPNSVL